MTELYYNVSTNISSIGDFLTSTNSIVSGMLGWGIYMAAFTILFIAMKPYMRAREAAAGSSFSLSVISVLLYTIGLIPIEGIYLAALMLAGSIFMLNKGR